jgi:predicted RNase H-like HicB family nuclease
VTDAEEAFERAKRAWDEFKEVAERGALSTAEGRRTLHGLKEALEFLTDFTQQAREEPPPSKLPSRRLKGGRSWDGLCSRV